MCRLYDDATGDPAKVPVNASGSNKDDMDGKPPLRRAPGHAAGGLGYGSRLMPWPNSWVRAALLTCWDVYAVAKRPFDHVRQSGIADRPVAATLAEFLKVCRASDCGAFKIVGGIAEARTEMALP